MSVRRTAIAAAATALGVALSVAGTSAAQAGSTHHTAAAHATSDRGGATVARDLTMAVRELPGANVAIISVPGPFAARCRAVMWSSCCPSVGAIGCRPLRLAA